MPLVLAAAAAAKKFMQHKTGLALVGHYQRALVTLLLAPSGKYTHCNNSTRIVNVTRKTNLGVKQK